MRTFLQKTFSADNIFSTLFIFLVMWGVSSVNFQFDILSPITDMFGDFEITDLVASKIEQETPADTSILLVNVGNLSRAEIAEQLHILNKYLPKAVGVDVFFRKAKLPEGDSALANAFRETKNLVLITKLRYNAAKREFDSLETSHEQFMRYAQPGFANFITEGEESFRTARTFVPFNTLSTESVQQTIPSFPSQLVRLVNEEAYQSLLKRKNEIEIIRYRGNVFGAKRKFFALDVQDLQTGNFHPSLIKDKIVLLGYMGEHLPDSKNTWDYDKFFTPLNEKYVGKAFQDMFGVVVHANVISMIMHQDYINVSNKYLDLVLAFLLCFGCVALFRFFLDWLPQLFDPITKIAQFILIVLLNLAVGYMFLVRNYRIDFGIALIAIALAPDLLEIYLHLVKRFTIFVRKKGIRIFQKERS